MSEMVERVARAMSEAFDREGRVFEDGQADMLACAAIEAMREPTDAMISAALESDLGDLVSKTQMANSYNAMIDEALK